MPEPIKTPCEAAWEKYLADGGVGERDIRVIFGNGWNAALAWIPFRIAQFREIEEAMRKEIEELKEKKDA